MVLPEHRTTCWEVDLRSTCNDSHAVGLLNCHWISAGYSSGSGALLPEPTRHFAGLQLCSGGKAAYAPSPPSLCLHLFCTLYYSYINHLYYNPYGLAQQPAVKGPCSIRRWRPPLYLFIVTGRQMDLRQTLTRGHLFVHWPVRVIARSRTSDTRSEAGHQTHRRSAHDALDIIGHHRFF